MKFANFTVSLPEWTPEEAVRKLAAMGYDGVEWRLADDPPRATPGFWQENRCTFPLSSFAEEAPRIRVLTEVGELAVTAIASYVQAADWVSMEAFTHERPVLDRVRENLSCLRTSRTGLSQPASQEPLDAGRTDPVPVAMVGA